VKVCDAAVAAVAMRQKQLGPKVLGLFDNSQQCTKHNNRLMNPIMYTVHCNVVV